MPAKKKKKTKIVKSPANSVAEFLADPMISTALIVFGLIALMLAIMEFSSATRY